MHRPLAAVALVVALGACDRVPEPDPEGPLYAERLGEPVPFLEGERAASFERGRELMLRAFTTDDGLGPTFNTDSCQGCHQVPVVGGSAPRYRDFFLVRAEREDGALVDVGTNGESPVRNLYSTDEGHVPEPPDTVVYARRNAPPFLGVGLFEFVEDAEILRRADPDDRDGDGISGRANYEQGEVGRFGVKSQASSVESFNRGAMFNQMGITSNPLFADFPEHPEMAALDASVFERVLGVPSAHAQVSAPGEPTTDTDGVPDPEISDAEQMDLLVFSLFLAPPKPAPRTEATREGARLFRDVGCTGCHVPELKSTVGRIPAYTDLLVHDLGEDNSDGLQVGLAAPAEFRTAPLWGVALHAPYLHDGKADTLREAIALHGGEGAASRDAFQALSASDQGLVIGFLESLGPFALEGNAKVHPEADLPSEGESGGPESGLSDDELVAFRQGEALFDRSMTPSEGLGPTFNADSCRACHQDPALGGAGGIDVSVLRFGRFDGHGVQTIDERPILFRQVIPGLLPDYLPEQADVIELRNPPTLLGLGRLDAVPESAILAHADPDDADGDGISGKARLVDGQLGRFGWKAQVPSLDDFLADAMFVELGVTADPALSDFTGVDDDEVPDPELPTSTFDAVAFYLHQLAPPAPAPPEDPAVAERGETLFAEVGCADCHLPDLGGEAAYSDLLLHDVADPQAMLVDQEGVDVLPTEFRTPPLWGVVDTAPYLHDASAPTLEAAITSGHHGEAEAARDAFEALSEADRAALIDFLETL